MNVVRQLGSKNNVLSVPARAFGWTPKQVPFKNWKIVKEDLVVVNTGKFKN